MRILSKKLRNLVTTSQFAALKGVSPQTIMNYVNSGRIEVIQIGRAEDILFIDFSKYTELSFDHSARHRGKIRLEKEGHNGA